MIAYTSIVLRIAIPKIFNDVVSFWLVEIELTVTALGFVDLTEVETATAAIIVTIAIIVIVIFVVTDEAAWLLSIIEIVAIEIFNKAISRISI